MKHPVTADGRYFVVRGRLWRMANPDLADDERASLVKRLMAARRAVRDAKADEDPDLEAAAHREVDEVKRALGERGPVWWNDGAPDFNRHMAKNTPYAEWYAEVRRKGASEDQPSNRSQRSSRQRPFRYSQTSSPQTAPVRGANPAIRMNDRSGGTDIAISAASAIAVPAFRARVSD